MGIYKNVPLSRLRPYFGNCVPQCPATDMRSDPGHWVVNVDKYRRVRPKQYENRLYIEELGLVEKALGLNQDEFEKIVSVTTRKQHGRTSCLSLA
jgi:hypothetical protein